MVNFLFTVRKSFSLSIPKFPYKYGLLGREGAASWKPRRRWVASALQKTETQLMRKTRKLLNYNDPILVLLHVSLLAMGHKCGLESEMTLENVAIKMNHLVKPVKLMSIINVK